MYEHMGAFIDVHVILSNTSENINSVDSKDIIESYIKSSQKSNKPIETENDDIIYQSNERIFE